MAARRFQRFRVWRAFSGTQFHREEGELAGLLA